MNNLDQMTKTALINAVQKAAKTEIMPRFRALSPDQVSSKSNRDDLVTVADQFAEEMITKAVRSILPGAFVLGEEAAAEDPGLIEALSVANLAVIIDPIDGTWNYAHGLANFGSIMAVVSHGKPIWGLLYDPNRDDWVEAAAGEGALFKVSNGPGGRELKHQAPKSCLEDLSGFVPVRQFPYHQQYGIIEDSYRFRQSIAIRCSCHEYRLMALGTMDFSLSGGSKPWDHVAGQLVLDEIGGASCRPDGSPYVAAVNGPLIAATSPETLTMVRYHMKALQW